MSPYDPYAMIFAGEGDAAVAVDEVHAAAVALLIGIDQLHHRVHGQAHAGGADETLLIVEYPIVDEDGQAVLVGQVDVHIDLVGCLQVAYAEVPGIARLSRADPLEHAFGLVVGVALFGDEEAGEGAVVLLHFTQVAGHLLGVLLAGQHPVTQEGVAGHHRGDEGGAHQVFLDFRVDGVGGQRQLGVDDAVADGIARGVVAQQRGGEKAAAEQEQVQ
mgnify:CR=1 FL=1